MELAELFRYLKRECGVLHGVLIGHSTGCQVRDCILRVTRKRAGIVHLLLLRATGCCLGFKTHGYQFVRGCLWLPDGNRFASASQ
jgi:hypothetical protein